VRGGLKIIICSGKAQAYTGRCVRYGFAVVEQKLGLALSHKIVSSCPKLSTVYPGTHFNIPWSLNQKCTALQRVKLSCSCYKDKTHLKAYTVTFLRIPPPSSLKNEMGSNTKYQNKQFSPLPIVNLSNSDTTLNIHLVNLSPKIENVWSTIEL